MRTIWAFLRQLIEVETRKAKAQEDLVREVALLGNELREIDSSIAMQQSNTERMAAALEGIQASLSNQGAEIDSVAWHVGIPQPEEK